MSKQKLGLEKLLKDLLRIEKVLRRQYDKTRKKSHRNFDVNERTSLDFTAIGVLLALCIDYRRYIEQYQPKVFRPEDYDDIFK